MQDIYNSDWHISITQNNLAVIIEYKLHEIHNVLFTAGFTEPKIMPTTQWTLNIYWIKSEQSSTNLLLGIFKILNFPLEKDLCPESNITPESSPKSKERDWKIDKCCLFDFNDIRNFRY